MAKQAIPFKYKGGVQKWDEDRTNAIAMHKRTLAALLGPDVPDKLMRIGGIFQNQLALGLYYAWEGQGEQARAFFQSAAATALAYVERGLPGLTSTQAPNLTLVARNGAIAAALVGEEDRARMLFGYAQQFAAALVTAEEVQPSDLGASLDPMALYPLTRAYSLLRLGRLSGFNALRFVDPPPEGRHPPSTWGPPWWGPTSWESADIDGLLDTAEICWRLGRTWRPGDFNSEKGLFPLLRTLAASLAAPGSEPARAAAQAALVKYFSMIRNLVEFSEIYLLVLDLQKAFPQVFTPVAPAAL